MEFKIWNRYEGETVRPIKVSTGMIGCLPGLEIRCDLEKDRLSNKNKIANIVWLLRREGIIE